jgi:uracil phosphoribosyltransferase
MPVIPNNPLLEELVYTLRDPATKQREFKNALKSIGIFLGIEIGKELETIERKVTTCLGAEAVHNLPRDYPILVSILRAGDALCDGLQEIYPHSKVGFISAKRDEETLKAEISYYSVPCVQDKVVIISDPMIATGGSIVDSVTSIISKENNRPRKIIVAGAIASIAGIQRIHHYNPKIKVYAAAVDPKLNEKGYIVPGLGDAGDRAYGSKL